MLKQVLACPVIVQPTDPYGVDAPATPVTVAVNVMVFPSTGLDGDEVTVKLTGVAGVTTIGPEAIAVAESDP